ncbi:MAG TPA: endonuclease/exonuclease/phosphatase family protein [Nocardioides sp.]|nr:endonuclease/exonuclease/phosphatase family protein [Nocardioides sp.]
MRSRGRRVAQKPRPIVRIAATLRLLAKPAAWTRDGLTATVACLTVVGVLAAVLWHARSDGTALASAQQSDPSWSAVVSTDGPTPSSSATTTPTAKATKAKVAAKRKKALDKQQLLARIAERRAKRATEPVTSTMRVASLNILGSNHVGRGLARAAGEASLLMNRGVDIVGLQEVQRDQRQVFLRQMPAYTMWPQDAVGRQGYRLQIMFRNSRFEMVDGGSVNAPFVGMSVPMPYVLLRDRSSGVEFWVIDAHLSPQGRQGERNAGTVIQEALVDRLNDTHPVVMVGDMNEHTSWFCRLASNVPAISANGGSSSACGPSGPIRIDWIVGSNAGDDTVGFSDYAQDVTTKRLGLSDHYLVYATAAVTATPSAPAGQ